MKMMTMMETMKGKMMSKTAVVHVQGENVEQFSNKNEFSLFPLSKNTRYTLRGQIFKDVIVTAEASRVMQQPENTSDAHELSRQLSMCVRLSNGSVTTLKQMP